MVYNFSSILHKYLKYIATQHFDNTHVVFWINRIIHITVSLNGNNFLRLAITDKEIID